MILSAHVKGYKSLADIGVDVRPLTMLVGPNAAGKSNLLDALSLLSAIGTGPDLKTAFEEHRGDPAEAFSYRTGRLEHLFSQDSVSFDISVDIKLDDRVVRSVTEEIRQVRQGLDDAGLDREQIISRPYLRYSVRVEMLTDSGHLRVIDESLAPLTASEPRREAGDKAPYISKEAGGRIVRRREDKKGGRPEEFDVGLDHSVLSKSVYPPHYPHIAALKEEIGRWRFYYLEPSAMRQEVPLKVATDIGKNGRDLAAFLHTVKKRNEEHFASIEKTLCTLLPAIEGLDVTRSPDGQLHLWVQEGDAEYSASVISEGTLRVLGLIAVASTHSDATVCGYEEPENGVHPSRLRVVARLLQGIVDNGRQIITTTHSPDLPEYLDDEDLVICYKDREGSHFEQFVGAPTGLFRKSALLSALDGDLLDRALGNTERSAEHQGVS